MFAHRHKIIVEEEVKAMPQMPPEMRNANITAPWNDVRRESVVGRERTLL